MAKAENTLPTFSYLLYDEHLLLSAVCNSGVRHFSRAQRLVCCLTQITLWMLGSAMWYGIATRPDVVLLDTGVLTLRLSDLFSTAATSFTVSLPVYVILVPMFCKQRPLVEQMTSSQSTCRFPYKTIGWILAILTSVSSSFFVIVYSLQFGADGSQAWLKDFVLTFLLSTFLLEPIEIFLVSYAQAVFIKPVLMPLTSRVGRVLRMKTVKKEPIPIEVVEKYKGNYEVPAPRVLPPAPTKAEYDPNWPERMTQGRDILARLVVLLIMSLTYFYIGVLDTDMHAYYVRTSLENSLLTGYEEVTTADGAWKWLSSELIPSLHPEYGYSGKKLRWLDKQFPVGTNAFRIGPVRLERTTIYPEDPIDSDLEVSGSKLHPELMAKQRQDALERQSGVTCSQVHNTSSVDSKRNGAKNGTVEWYTTVDLPRDASQAATVIDFLQRNNWILMVSDTLILRANFYHPDVKLFSTLAITLQYIPGGAVELLPSIQTFRLFQYETTDDFVQLLFHILFLIFYMYNILAEAWSIRKSGRIYFSSFFNILVLCNIGLSTAVIVIFGLRYILATAALTEINQATGPHGINEFIDISAASQWDATFKVVLSFSIFISTFSILRVLNFSKNVATVFALPRLMYRDAFGFLMYMVILLLSYTICGILIFGKHMKSFSALKETSYVLFELSLGRAFGDVFGDDIKRVDSVLGPLYYTTFVLVFICCLVNLGVGMLCNWLNYCETSGDIEVDTAMGDYFWNSFRSLLGMRHETQAFDDEAPLPDRYIDETLERTEAVLQEAERVTDLMYKFECRGFPELKVKDTGSGSGLKI
ncbi:polycystin-2-like [Branchiostoma lanceolatum]|uniref:polycystin-2-like n=1 Tax=Branchiostoma lanceolatum TaxID=7740 RepID=UPI0034538A9D